MNNSLIANAIMTMLSSFFSNSGKEIAKNAGKDIYEKVKHCFGTEEEKTALQNLETDPFSNTQRESIEKILMLKLYNKEFFQEISVILNITTSNTIILELVLNSILDIKAELKHLYPWWINAGPDKKGQYQNRIEQLELQLTQLEEKFFVIISSSPEQGSKRVFNFH